MFQRETAERKQGMSTQGRAQFTPGPWYRNIPPANKYPTIWSGRNKHVAYIKQLQDDSEAEANINLIAAAPAMYEALQALLALIGDEDLPDNGELSGASICDFARSALAQAEGRQA